MADEFDVDALLEEALDKKKDHKKDGKESRRHKSDDKKSKDGKESRRRRSKSKERNHKSKDGKASSPSRDRRHERRRSRSRDRHAKPDAAGAPAAKRNKSPERRPRRERSRSRDRRRPSPARRARSPSPPGGQRGGAGGGAGGAGVAGDRRMIRERSPQVLMTPEERDARTIFVMQLSHRCRARDIEDFFSAVGKIRDVRLILCNKTRRFKGIAYVEFKEIESVPLALGLNGQKLLGIPVVVQPSQAEKNRVNQVQTERVMSKPEFGPMRLYVGSLHFNITEEMLKAIFEPFGKIMTIQLMVDHDTGRSKGYGFITYAEAEDAKKALEQMNGFELAGRPIKVGHITDSKLAGFSSEAAAAAAFHGNLEYEENGRMGFELGASGRLALMAKLAEGTGLKLPEMAAQALAAGGGSQTQSVAAISAAAHHQQQHHQQQQQQQQQQQSSNAIATQCFMLSNMFDPSTETGDFWDREIRDDVIEECNKAGGVLHIYVDKHSPQGNVFVKCTSVNSAAAAVASLHGRWFAGKVITAAYVPVLNYHSLFPDAVNLVVPLVTSR